MNKAALNEVLARQALAYRSLGYWDDDTLYLLLCRCSKRWPDKIAIRCGDQQLTFKQWHDQATRVAGALQTLGILKSDIVAVQLPNRAEFLIAFLAISACGAVMQTIHMPYRDAELRTLLIHSEAKIVISMGATGDFSPAEQCVALLHELPQLEQVIAVDGACPGAKRFSDLLTHAPAQGLPDLTGEDEFVLLYTSGTTGNPKGVPIRYCWFMANARIAGEDWGFHTDDVILSAAPFTHLYGLWTIILTLYHGAQNSLLPTFSPPAFAACIADSKPTGIFAVPAHIAALMALGLWDDIDPAGIRFICQAGSIVPEHIASAIDDKLTQGTVLQLFGMSELQAGVYTLPGDTRENRVRTSGAAPRGMEIKIVDEHGEPSKPGDEGQLLIRGIAVFRGYRRNEATTLDAFSDDGWFRTGDMGHLTPGGKLVITGRSKELVNRGGIKYHPAEVEDIVNRLDTVSACAIVPYSDDILGERACIFVEPAAQASVSLDAICAALAQAGLAKFKWPERLEVVSHMPLTPTRKIIRGRLAERLS